MDDEQLFTVPDYQVLLLRLTTHNVSLNSYEKLRLATELAKSTGKTLNAKEILQWLSKALNNMGIWIFTKIIPSLIMALIDSEYLANQAIQLFSNTQFKIDI